MYDSCFFRSNSCSSTVSGDDSICAQFNESVKALKRSCERSIKKRDDDTEKEVKATNDKYLQKSPSRQQGENTRVAKEISNESKKRWAVKKHAEIIEKNGIELGIEHQDLLFPKILKELGNIFF